MKLTWTIFLDISGSTWLDLRYLVIAYQLRCKDITKKEILDAIDKGAKNLNQIKTWTRFGMGPCQGRTCHYSISRIVASKLGCRPEDLGYLTGRSPIRPVPLDKAIGDYEYNQITKVDTAPL